MNDTAAFTEAAPAKTEHFDVLIVGAGISGIGGAYHLTKQCPGTRFVVLETQESFGGTWLTHRYPGIRSDSDLYTFGYRFKPWTRRADRDGRRDPQLHGRGDRGERSRPAHPLSAHRSPRQAGPASDNLWTIEATRTDTGETVRFTANFLWMCQGYYRHSEGYTPHWDGMETLQGPDRASADLAGGPGLRGQERRRHRLGRHRGDAHPGDRGRLRPRHDAAALADLFQHRPQRDRPRRRAARAADRRDLDPRNRAPQDPARPGRVHPPLVQRAGGREAGTARRRFARYLGPTTTSTRTSRRRYRPWRQRIAFIPDGDLFEGDRAGKASVVTDEIERFTETGILLKSGKQLEADIIITATGFNLNVLGDIDFTIDGKPLVFSDTVTYRGMMFTGVPNMAWVFGYFRASWTLRADLVADFVCRLLNHMKQKGARQVTVALRPEDKDMPLLPWIDPENFNPGYLHARHASAAEARRQAGMAAHAGLLARERPVPGDRSGRPAVRLRLRLSPARLRRRRPPSP